MSNWQFIGNANGRRSSTVGVPIRAARISKVIGLAVLVLLAAVIIGADTAAMAQCNPERVQRHKLPSWVQMPNAETLKTRGNVGELPAWYTDVNIIPDEVSASL